jgi:hypothetical protein
MTVEIIVCPNTSVETVRSSTDALTCQIINYVMWIWKGSFQSLNVVIVWGQNVVFTKVISKISFI